MSRMPEPATKLELVKVARAFAENKVVIAGVHVPADLVPVVFLPVALGVLAGWSSSELARISLFAVAGRHHTIGMQINGFPSFTECAIWRREDMLRSVHLANAAADVLTELLSRATSGRTLRAT